VSAPGREPEPAIADVADERCEHAARVLARAFCDNPLNVAVIDSSDRARRLRCNLHGMRASLTSARRGGLAKVAIVAGRVAGAFLAVPPGAYPLPTPGWGRQALCLLGQGWGVATRWGEVFDALQAHHPREPHWYLGTLGVDPAQQRRGIGAALLRAWLERVDESHAPAYLETDREPNLQFYARAGFAIVDRSEVLGTPIWHMQRPAFGSGAISDRPRAH